MRKLLIIGLIVLGTGLLLGGCGKEGELKMTKAKVDVLGIHKVSFTNDLFEKAMNIKYSGVDLSNQERTMSEKAVKEELASIVLIELLITNPTEEFDVGNFTQPDSDQAPYDEAFLSIDGTRILSRDEKPPGDKLRLAFFLHYFDPKLPLKTEYGNVSCPPIQEMSARLKRLMPYEPMDNCPRK